MAAIASINVDLIARTGPFSKGIGDAKKSLYDFSKQAEGVGRLGAHMRNFGKDAEAVSRGSLSASMSLSRLAIGATAAIVAAKSLSGAFSSPIRLAAAAEDTQIQFSTLLNSATKAHDLIGEIRKFAAESPLTFDQSTGVSKQLLSYGVVADQIVPTMRMLSDAAMGNAESLGRLSYAYGQVTSAGRLYGTELRQLTELGLPIIPELGRILKVRPEDVRKQVEDGGVSSAHLTQALVNLTSGGGMFAGMTAKRGESITGQFERLVDDVQAVSRDIGFVLIEELGIKEATRNARQFFGELRSGVEGVRPVLRLVRDNFIFLARFSLAPFRLIGAIARSAVDMAGHLGLGRLIEIPTKLAQVGIRVIDYFERGVVLIGRVGGSIAKALVPVNVFAGVMDGIVGGFDDIIEGIDFDEVQVAQGLFDIAKPVARFFDDLIDFSIEANLWVGRNLVRPFHLLGAAIDDTALRLQAILRIVQTFGKGAGQGIGGIAAEVFVNKDAIAADFKAALKAGPNIAALREKFRLEDQFAAVARPNRLLNAVLAGESDLMPRMRAERFNATYAGRAALGGGMYGAFTREKQLDAGMALLGGSFRHLDDVTKSVAGSMVKIPESINPAVLELARQANETFGPQVNPVGEFWRDVQNLHEGFNRGRFKSVDIFEAAVADRFRRLRESANMEFKLPGVVEFGSSEFAKAAIGLASPQQGKQAVFERLAAMMEQFKNQNHKDTVDLQKMLLDWLKVPPFNLPLP